MSTPLWNKKLKCPFCAFEFETTRMRSTVIKIKEKMTDFGNIYDGECAYFYAVTSCPQCTFSALNKDFDSIRAHYEPKVMDLCKAIVQSDRKKPDIFALGSMTPQTAILRHELAIAFTKKRSFKNLGTIAGLYMHLVWIYRLMGESEKEKTAMGEAAKAYEEFFEKGGDLPEKIGAPGVLYLIGELYRRQGLLKEARRFFERALANKEIRSFPMIANQARDMMMAAKEQMGQGQTEAEQ